MAETHLAVCREKQAGDAAVDARGGAVGFLRDVTADDAVFLQTQAASNFWFFFPHAARRRRRATHVLQHFDVVNVGRETQRQPWQEGVVAGVQEPCFQQDVLSGPEGKVRLLAGKRGRRMRKKIRLVKQQVIVRFMDLQF